MRRSALSFRSKAVGLSSTHQKQVPIPGLERLQISPLMVQGYWDKARGKAPLKSLHLRKYHLCKCFLQPSIRNLGADAKHRSLDFSSATPPFSFCCHYSYSFEKELGMQRFHERVQHRV